MRPHLDEAVPSGQTGGDADSASLAEALGQVPLGDGQVPHLDRAPAMSDRRGPHGPQNGEPLALVADLWPDVRPHAAPRFVA